MSYTTNSPITNFPDKNKYVVKNLNYNKKKSEKIIDTNFRNQNNTKTAIINENSNNYYDIIDDTKKVKNKNTTPTKLNCKIHTNEISSSSLVKKTTSNNNQNRSVSIDKKRLSNRKTKNSKKNMETSENKYNSISSNNKKIYSKKKNDVSGIAAKNKSMNYEHVSRDSTNSLSKSLEMNKLINCSKLNNTQSMDSSSLKLSSSVKVNKKNLKNTDQHDELKENNSFVLKKKLLSITKESRVRRINKMDEDDYYLTINSLLPYFNNTFNVTRVKRYIENSRTYGKGQKSNSNTNYSFLANLSVKGGKSKVPESVYNKLHMNNKFTKGNFTDSNGKPLWCKKNKQQSVEKSDDSSTHSGDICALVSDALLAYCDGNFQIKDQLKRVCTLEPNGDLQEFTKNDHLYTMENVINNTVRTFSKMEEFKRNINKENSQIIEKGSQPYKNFIPEVFNFEKEIKIIFYNRIDPTQLVGPIQFIPLDTGPTKFFYGK
uniref:WD_REPEATS_REGION domain-containing protein n=1 Tax=Strongyloides stercoralis TaxID=6248 RepID=A0A0K0ECG6_STRER